MWGVEFGSREGGGREVTTTGLNFKVMTLIIIEERYMNTRKIFNIRI